MINNTIYFKNLCYINSAPWSMGEINDVCFVCAEGWTDNVMRVIIYQIVSDPLSHLQVSCCEDYRADRSHRGLVWRRQMALLLNTTARDLWLPCEKLHAALQPSCTDVGCIFSGSLYRSYVVELLVQLHLNISFLPFISIYHSYIFMGGGYPANKLWNVIYCTELFIRCMCNTNRHNHWQILEDLFLFHTMCPLFCYCSGVRICCRMVYCKSELSELIRQFLFINN